MIKPERSTLEHEHLTPDSIDFSTYPKNYDDNLVYRAEILTKGTNDPEFAEGLKEICSRDRLFLFNAFYYTYDPRTEDKTLPFITYLYQDQFILWDQSCLAKAKDNFVDKSRDMGVTWMLIGNDIGDWLFNKERIEIRWGSRKEQYVDTKGDMDSLFEKMRLLLKKMPSWMLPKGFNFNTHDNYMRLVNPETGSIITGEATNSSFGRGGRKLRVRYDEFAFWEQATPAWDGTADVTNCRTAISTPNGSANKFAQLAKGPEIEDKRSLHWTLHPLKRKGAYYIDNSQEIKVQEDKANQLWLKGVEIRSNWYDVECKRRGTEQSIGQELDISYLRSGLLFFNMVELKKQRIWDYYKRSDPLAQINWGKYITANILEMRGKYKLMERPDGNIRIFELPENGSTFVIGADTSEGLPKGDKCSAVVRDKWTRDVFATVDLLIKPEEFAPLLFALSEYFKKQNESALLAVENNNHGYTTCKELADLGANLWMTTASESNQGQVKRGFTTTPRTRPLILDRLEEDIRKHSAQLRDPDLIGQCETFIHNDKTGKPEADGDFHDDLVIATAIAGYAIDVKPYKAKADVDYKRRQMSYDRRKFKNAGAKF